MIGTLKIQSVMSIITELYQEEIMKTIDVVIPVYNGIPYVITTLKSVINQTRHADQIIVVNDGSKDETLSELYKIKSLHPEQNITIIDKPNGGHSSATNVGICHSKADYIALVDADDVWAPTKLELQEKVFQTSTIENLGIVFCDYGNIDKNDNVITDFPCFKMDKSVRGNVFRDLIVRGNLIAGSNSAVMIKRECFLKVGPLFDEYLRCGEDWEMWIRLAKLYNFDHVPLPLVYIRRHPNNLSNENMLHMKSNLYILNKWVKEIHEFGGHTLVAEYLALSTVNNLKQLLLKSEYSELRIWVKNLTKDFPFPRLFIVWGFLRKVRKKIFKFVTS